jgi:dTDP-4-dehydrorhamnose reductase
LTILRLARERSELKIVDDQIGAPTWCRMLAEVTSQMLSQHCPSVTRAPSIADISGLYHVVCGGHTSWHGFARKILEIVSGHASHAMPELKPIPTTEYPTPAKRPLNSRLSTEKLKRMRGLIVPAWEESLILCMNELESITAV